MPLALGSCCVQLQICVCGKKSHVSQVTSQSFLCLSRLSISFIEFLFSEKNKRRFLEELADKICVCLCIECLFILLLAINSLMFLNYCSVSFGLVVTLSNTFPGLLLMDLLNDSYKIHQAL